MSSSMKKIIPLIAVNLVSILFWYVMMICSQNEELILVLGNIFEVVFIYISWATFYKRLDDVKNSSAVKFIERNGWLFLLLVVLSAVLTFISYPGIWYSDSYERVKMAKTMEDVVSNAIDGANQNYYFRFTPVFSYLMSVAIAFTGNIAFYTMAQTFFFMSSIVIFIYRVNKKVSQRVIGIILFITSPVVYCTATYYEAGIGCVTGIILLMVALSQLKLTNSFDKYVQLIGIASSCFIIFGYRINAFTIIPVVLVSIFFLYRKNKKQLLLIAISFMIGFFSVSWFTNWLHIKTTMSSAEAFSWEIVTAIQSMPEKDRGSYLTYLDDIYGDGATEKAIEVSTNTNIVPLQGVLNATMDPSKGDMKETQKKVINKYISFAVNNKRLFIKNKWYFVSCMMGIKQPLNLWEWNYNRWDLMNQYQFSDTEVRQAYFDSYPKAVNNSLLLRPWVLFLITLILLIIESRAKGLIQTDILAIEWTTFFVAVFYYGGFLLNTQSMEFRYFFPSCILLLLLMFSASISLIYFAVNKVNVGAIQITGKAKGAFLQSWAYLWLPLVVICIVYIEHYLPISSEIKEIKNMTQLYANDSVAIYYGNKNLYYVTNNNDNSKKYFLHFYTTDSEVREHTSYGFINQDFDFSQYAVRMPFWEKEELAIFPLPNNYKIDSIETGQYEDDTRFWQFNTDEMNKLVSLEEFQLCDINDDNWNHGISTSTFSPDENILLVKSDDLSFEYLPGKTLNLCGISTKVTDVEKVAEYYYLYVDSEFSADQDVINVKVVE